MRGAVSAAGLRRCGGQQLPGTDGPADHGQWLEEQLASRKAGAAPGRSPARTWNSRIVASWRRPLYDPKNDPCCPLRFRRKKMQLAAEEAQQSAASSNLVRPRTASSVLRKSTRASLGSSRVTGRSRSTAPAQASFGRSTNTFSGSTVRPSLGSVTGGGSIKKRKKRKPKIGVTYQQTAGESGAKEDLQVLRVVMERESRLQNLRRCANTFVKKFRWYSSSASSLQGSSCVKSQSRATSVGSKSLPPSASQQSVSNSNGARSAAAERLLDEMKQDVEVLRLLSLRVVRDVVEWRQRSMNSLIELRNQTQMKPRQFVFGGDDYLLRMVVDTEFLKDVQPLLTWVDGPAARNPFLLAHSDQNSFANLEIQLEEAAAETFARTPPPVGDPIVDAVYLRWASMVLVAEELMFGKLPAGGSTLTAMASASQSHLQGGPSTFSLATGQNLSVFSDDGGQGVVSAQETSTSDVTQGERAPGSPSSDNPNPEVAVKSGPTPVRSKQQVRSRIRQIIQQNVDLRRQLERMKTQYGRELKTVRCLEDTEAEHDPHYRMQLHMRRAADGEVSSAVGGQEPEKRAREEWTTSWLSQELRRQGISLPRSVADS